MNTITGYEVGTIVNSKTGYSYNIDAVAVPDTIGYTLHIDGDVLPLVVTSPLVFSGYTLTVDNALFDAICAACGIVITIDKVAMAHDVLLLQTVYEALSGIDQLVIYALWLVRFGDSAMLHHDYDDAIDTVMRTHNYYEYMRNYSIDSECFYSWLDTILTRYL